MKQIIITILLSIISMNAFADWKYKYDEKENCTFSYYINEKQLNLFFTSSADNYVGFITGNGEFKTNNDGYVSGLVEFFEDGVSVEKVRVNFKIDRKGHDTCGFDDDMVDMSVKILNHIKNKGSVRIVASRVNIGNFELIIPQNHDIKWGD